VPLARGCIGIEPRITEYQKVRTAADAVNRVFRRGITGIRIRVPVSGGQDGLQLKKPMKPIRSGDMPNSAGVTSTTISSRCRTRAAQHEDCGAGSFDNLIHIGEVKVALLGFKLFPSRLEPPLCSREERPSIPIPGAVRWATRWSCESGRLKSSRAARQPLERSGRPSQQASDRPTQKNWEARSAQPDPWQ